MGFVFSNLFKGLVGQEQNRMIIIGLDNAGKTTVLYKLHLGEVVTTVPTVGFNVETVNYEGLKFQVWDLGGQTGLRPYWRCYYQDTNAVVFVVDSADKERLEYSRQELEIMLQEDELKGVPVLVLANKQDMPGAMGYDEIYKGLGLSSIKNRQWQMFRTSAMDGTGLKEAFEWLTNTLKGQ